MNKMDIRADITKVIYAIIISLSFPHFYKKGNIVVQYIEEDEKIISDLKDILGEQFAGYEQEDNKDNRNDEDINIFDLHQDKIIRRLKCLT